jgi:hypothetical protein
MQFQHVYMKLEVVVEIKEQKSKQISVSLLCSGSRILWIQDNGGVFRGQRGANGGGNSLQVYF